MTRYRVTAVDPSDLADAIEESNGYAAPFAQDVLPLLATAVNLLSDAECVSDDHEEAWSEARSDLYEDVARFLPRHPVIETPQAAIERLTEDRVRLERELNEAFELVAELRDELTDLRLKLAQSQSTDPRFR